MSKSIHRNDVWRVSTGEKGSERLCLVVSDDWTNKNGAILSVVPVEKDPYIAYGKVELHDKVLGEGYFAVCGGLSKVDRELLEESGRKICHLANGGPKQEVKETVAHIMRERNISNPGQPKRMEVWIAGLQNAAYRGENPLTCGVRPVLVVSNDVANRHSPLVTVIPITSRVKRMDLPTHVPLTCEGLKSESVALCENLITLPKTVLHNRVSQVQDYQVVENIQRALARQLSID